MIPALANIMQDSSLQKLAVPIKKWPAPSTKTALELIKQRAMQCQALILDPTLNEYKKIYQHRLAAADKKKTDKAATKRRLKKGEKEAQKTRAADLGEEPKFIKCCKRARENRHREGFVQRWPTLRYGRHSTRRELERHGIFW